MDASIFISHSFSDGLFAARLAGDLRAHGYDARSFSDLVPKGEALSPTRLAPRLDKAIIGGTFFVPVLTPAAVTSPWVHKELAVAVESEARTNSVKILPVLGEPCVLPPQLGLRAPADFTESYTDGLSALLAMLAQSSSVPAAVDVTMSASHGASAIQSLFAELPRTKQLFDLAPSHFETFVADVLQRAGYEVKLTYATHDAGIDLFAFSGWDHQHSPILVQCKRYAPNHQMTLELVDSLAVFAPLGDISRALIVTTASCIDSLAHERREWKSRWCFGLDRRKWAQVFLWLAQSKGIESQIQDRVAAARERYAELVDRRFLSRLDAWEAQELLQLDLLLDAADAPFYEPIKKRLREVRDRFSGENELESRKVR